jgi:FMN-dependent NADH-azoreductase
MPKLLHIDASPRSDDRSQSKKLSQAFVDAYVQANSGTEVTHRAVGSQPPPTVSEPWIAASFGGVENGALASSDTLVDELLASDIIVIGTPMYNFGTPAQLKAWFDQVIRVGRTFKVDDDGMQGLVTGKKAFICSVYGGQGYAAGESMESYNFLDGHLKAMLGFIGITDVEFVRVQNTNGGDDAAAKGHEEAAGRMKELVSA